MKLHPCSLAFSGKSPRDIQAPEKYHLFLEDGNIAPFVFQLGGGGGGGGVVGSVVRHYDGRSWNLV